MNGSGPIIIRLLAGTPGITVDEVRTLGEIEQRYAVAHGCSRADAWFICRVVWRLVRP